MEKKKFNNAIEKAENLSADTEKVKAEGNEKTYEQLKREEEARKNARILNAEKKSNREREKLEKELFKQELKKKAKEERMQLRRERSHQRIELKRERQQAKEDYRKQRLELNNEKHKRNSTRGVGGWFAAVIALGCACLVLATLLISNVYSSGGGEVMLSNVYERAFYDLVGYVDNIDVNFSKLISSNDNENKQKILADLMVQANLAEADLATLPLEQSSRNSTIKFINQVGDFSKYLNNKLIEGDLVSDEDESTLKEMRKINANLREKLKNLQGELGGNFNFVTLLTGEENVIFESFSELEYHAVDYPKMIYDGPFADEPDKSSQNSSSEQKGESSNLEIKEDEAIKVFKKAFADYNPTEIKVTGMAEGKKFKVYNVEGRVGEEYTIFAQVSLKGDLVTFDSYTKAKEQKHTRDECIDNALKFLNKLGYKSIKAVWTTAKEDNMTYINFAGTTKNGEIILYSDLIKVAVCMDSGRVCDMDAHLYLENHKEREIPEAKIRVEEAELKVKKDIEIKTSRLALIPVTPGKERLAYEFYGESEEGTFYVYVDAVTGKELKIFKVISTTDGDLLL